MTADEDEQRAARRELSAERWKAHRELHDSEKELNKQYRDSHAEQHASIARNLAEYKAQSNEWRGSLSDMRSSFVTNTEVKSLLGQAEGTHGAIAAKIDAVDAQLERRFEELSKRIDTEREERRDQQNLHTGSVDTWRWIAGFLGIGGISAIVWALLNMPK